MNKCLGRRKVGQSGEIYKSLETATYFKTNLIFVVEHV